MKIVLIGAGSAIFGRGHWPKYAKGYWWNIQGRSAIVLNEYTLTVE